MAEKKAVLGLVVVFDDDKTNSEALAVALDRLLKTAKCLDVMSEYGPVGFSETYVLPLNPSCIHQLDWVHSADDEHDYDRDLPKPRLRMRVREEVYGVDVTVLADDGHSMGSVLMDYFDNRLTVQVYDGDVDEPTHSHVLSDDVDRDRKAKREDDTGAP